MEISVVMGCFNDSSLVERTMNGVLNQAGVDIECIVVDDGSNDMTWSVLQGWARQDSRVRVERFDENGGLTNALLVACSLAKGEFIARHDMGDVSQKERLRKQQEVLVRYPEISMASSWVDYEGPVGEPAGGVRRDSSKADEDLEIKSDEQRRVRGPYHGSTMFRKSDYEAVGGYRSEFYFAQDVDLWLRLHERGRHHLIPEELYTARLAPESISGRYRAEQDRCLELAVSAARARRAGKSEAPYLAQAAGIRPSNLEGVPRTARLRAGSLYSMGCQLLAESPGSASRYFMRSLRVYPFNPKAWLRLVESVGRRYRLLR